MNFILRTEKILPYDWFPAGSADTLDLCDRFKVSKSTRRKGVFTPSQGRMNTRPYAVYNLTSRMLLNDKVGVTDSASEPLKMLDLVVSGLGLESGSALWLTPLPVIHRLPRVFPFDLIYLDRDCGVVEAVEIAPGVEFPSYRQEVVSAVLVPPNTLHATGTRRGDRLLICPAEELEAFLGQTVAFFNGKVPAAGDPESSGEPDTRPTVPEVPVITEQPKTGTEPLAAVANFPVPTTPLGRSILEALATSRHPSGNGTAHAPKASSPGSDESKEPSAPVISITEVFPEAKSPGKPRAALKPESDDERLFSNWIASPSDLPSAIAQNRVGQIVSGSSFSEAPVELPSAHEPMPVFTGDSEKAAPVTKGTVEPDPVDYKERHRFLFERVNQAKAERRSASAVSEQPQASEVDANSAPSQVAQKATPKPNGLSPVAVRQRVGTPRATRSTTTFATSSLPMWRVSAPTALTTFPGSIQGLRPPSPEAKTAQTAESEGNTESQPAPQDRAAAELCQPSQTGPRKMWPRTSPAAVAPGVGTVEAKQTAGTPTNGSLALEPGGIKPAAKTNGSRPIQPRNQANSATTAPQNYRPAASERPERNGNLESSPQRAEGNGKSNAQSSLRSRFNQWLNPVVVEEPSDRRRADRRYIPGMVAHYFTGGAPKPLTVADISMSGFYLLTEDRWMPGTMIQMTMQKLNKRGEPKQSITVLSKIVRRGADGVGAEFVMPESIDSTSHDIQPSRATDRLELARFL